jgi:hypothetical protein
MSKESIGASNVFYIYSALSILGAIYAYFIIKETKFLLDKDKKLLYTPAEYLSNKASCGSSNFSNIFAV